METMNVWLVEGPDGDTEVFVKKEDALAEYHQRKQDCVDGGASIVRDYEEEDFYSLLIFYSDTEQRYEMNCYEIPFHN